MIHRNDYKIFNWKMCLYLLFSFRYSSVSREHTFAVKKDEEVEPVSTCTCWGKVNMSSCISILIESLGSQKRLFIIIPRITLDICVVI